MTQKAKWVEQRHAPPIGCEESDEEAWEVNAPWLPGLSQNRSLQMALGQTSHHIFLEASLSPWGIISSIFHPRRNTTLSSRSQNVLEAFASRDVEASTRKWASRRCLLEHAGLYEGQHLHFPLMTSLERSWRALEESSSFPQKKLLFFRLKRTL